MRHSDDEIARRPRRFLWFDEQPVPDTGFFRTLDEALWKPLLSAEGAADPRLALEKMGLLTRDEQKTLRASVAGVLLCSRRLGFGREDGTDRDR